MIVVRCTVCAFPYMGEVAPSNCPSCGVNGRHFVRAGEWREVTTQQLSPPSQSNLRKALELETNNAEFYRVAGESATEPVFEAMFAALARINASHVAVISKLLGADVPAPAEAPSFVSVVEYLAAANGREKKMARFYRRAAKEAEEAEIETLFGALTEAASTHMSISKIGQ